MVAAQAAGGLGTAPEAPKPHIGPSSWWTRIRATQADLSDRERLFALWLGAAAVLLKVRLEILLLAPAMFRYKPVLAPWLPLAAYQDVLLIALASWTWWMVLPLLRRPLARRSCLHRRLAGGTASGRLCGPQFRSLQIPAGSADLSAYRLLKTSGLYPRQPCRWAPVRGLTRTAVRADRCSRHSRVSAPPSRPRGARVSLAARSRVRRGLRDRRDGLGRLLQPVSVRLPKPGMAVLQIAALSL